jgi:excisionase family DNA binding protein
LSTDFFSVEEAAEKLGFSVGTVRNRIGDGSLFAFQSVKRGAWRIPSSALSEYMASLGIGPKFVPKLRPPTETQTVSTDDYFALRIAPRLHEAGVSNIGELMTKIEADPTSYAQFSEVFDMYATYLRSMSNDTISSFRQTAPAGDRTNQVSRSLSRT